MNNTVSKLTKQLILNELIDENRFNETIKSFDCKFPLEYLEFMRAKNGGEGPIGDNNYIRFWPFEELKEANSDYHVEEFAPELLLIGTDGGGTAYGFRKLEGTFVEVPFIGMSDPEEIVERGKTFLEFVSYLASI